MADRLKIKQVATNQELISELQEALKDLTKRDFQATVGQQMTPLLNCCQALMAAGTTSIIVQSRVQDPDFLAEFGAYYSRQFVDIPRFCTRVHFFSQQVQTGQSVLTYLDQVDNDSYLGFITLRPVMKSPVGASILSVKIADGYMRCVDTFPVNIAGKEFRVTGTPFMQQDNAVGACAQASIWMALRTLRKREGDRAYDPAQITDAATRYFVNGRIRPNRTGLTQMQMIEAIRAAGYSPHTIPMGNWQGVQRAMSQMEIFDSLMTIHPYIESEIPVILILFPPSGGHAVVAIGHTWDETRPSNITLNVSLPSGQILPFSHTSSWVPSLLIHNDNTGPYQIFDTAPVAEYSFQYAALAIPLLPVDVFMSGEEAMTVATEFLADIFHSFILDGIKDEAGLSVLVTGLAIRLLLVEKRKLRKWAATENMVPELKEKIRLMEMPKRVWMLEIHQAGDYGTQRAGNTPNSLVGIMLVDPTADLPIMSMLLIHLNLPALVGLPHGVMVTWSSEVNVPSIAVQTNDNGPTRPIRL